VNELPPSQVKHIDLPEHLYPLTIEYFVEETGEVRRKAVVSGPGVLEVPSQRELGTICKVRVIYGDGAVVEA